MKTFVPTALVCSLIFLTANFALGQLAPAGGGTAQVAPGEYFSFSSEGTFTYGSGFTYINYSTREFDSILTNLASNGTFSGISSSTGRVVSGQISSASITMTYNGVTASAANLSVYGPTRSLAGNWLGVLVDPLLGAGCLHFGVSAQGGVIVTSYFGFGFDAGVGTIDVNGRL